jgi:hypothetical protein
MGGGEKKDTQNMHVMVHAPVVPAIWEDEAEKIV